MAQYHFPPIELLEEKTESDVFSDSRYVERLKGQLGRMFESFGMDVNVYEGNGFGYCIRFRLKPGAGVTFDAVKKMQTEIEMALDGQPVEFREQQNGREIAIAIRNAARPKIMLKDMIRSRAFRDAKSKVAIAAGVNLFEGDTVIDLQKYTNLIVVGMTGAGKTTFLNDIILSILYKARPDEVRLAMIDTKGADLPLLNGIPHMQDMDVATTTEDGLDLLRWMQNEATERLLLMRSKKADSLEEYNRYAEEKKPRYVLIIDEYAEFKRGTGEDVDRIVIDLAKCSAQIGIHLIVATQGARSQFLSTELKEAIPARACLAVADKRESRLVMEKTGADRLAGDGDMIITANEEDPGLFLQAAYASDEEIDRVAAFLRNEKG